MNNKEGNNSAFEKEGYKQTKLGWIPEDWSTPAIDEVFEFLKTTSFSRNQLNYDDENDTYYIHYGDIHSTYKTPILDFEEIENVPKLNNDLQLPASVQYLKDGDVVIADASEDYEGVGTAIELQNLDEKKVISGLHTFALRDKEGLTIEGFRTYIFKNPIVKKALKTIATGSKVFGISKGNVQKFKIVLPTFPEQQKIASILSTWDKAIAAQEKLVAEEQELKNGLMQQLLSGKKRFPGFIEEWEVVKLRELLELLTDFESNGSFADVKANVTITDKTGYAWYVRATDLEKETDLELVKYVNEHSYDFLKKTSLTGNELLITKRGEIGKVYFFKKVNIKATLAPNLYLLKLNNKINAKFLYYLFKSYEGFKLLNSINASTTMGALYKEDVKNLKLVIPTIEEQEKIISTFNELDKNINHQVLKLKKFKQQKQGLMQQLLTGEKRVKV